MLSYYENASTDHLSRDELMLELELNERFFIKVLQNTSILLQVQKLTNVKSFQITF